jgi:hypothetical protein
MPEPVSDVGSRLDADRRELLDLTLRNPLLNYRPRARSLEFVGESPEQVFGTLVREGKRMSFLPAPGMVEAGPLAQPDETAADRPSVAQSDRRLQTGTPADQLQARLLAIFYAARTSIEEQGVNTLYLALGMLGWYESDASQKPLRAPLILVPVALERSSARERFRLRYSEEDLGPNLSLAEKLKADFRLTLPEVADPDELQLASYFDAVSEAVREHTRWTVDRESIVLGFFSFGKFLMYRDLDDASWPEAIKPGQHPILRALIADGFGASAQAPDENESLDDRLAPGDGHHVLDADSSQCLAILDAIEGRNLVIQGPPGTGKSQTITNLIAEAVGRGKSVLFVAEKMAALEVVKRRLDAVGLGDVCLELHSRKTKKKEVLDELRRTMAARRPKRSVFDDELRLLGEVRQRLNDYVAAINTPLAPSGLAPHEAIGGLLQVREELSGVGVPQLEVDGFRDWSSLDFKRRLALVEQLERRVEQLGVPAKHAFFGARRAALLPAEAERLRPLVAIAREADDRLRAAGGALAQALQLEPAIDRAGVRQHIEAAKLAADSDRWRGIAVASDAWETRAAELQELLDAGSARADLHARYDPTLLPEAWSADLLEVRAVLNTQGRHWWRFFSIAYYRARFRLAAFCQGAAPRDLEEMLALIDAVRAARAHGEVIARGEALGLQLFGSRWRGVQSDWAALRATAEWTQRLRDGVRAGRLPGRLLTFLASDPQVADLPGLISAAETIVDGPHREAWRAITTFLEFDAPARYPGAEGLEDVAFSEQDRLCADWPERIAELQPLVAFNQLAARCAAEGLANVVSVAERWEEASRHLVRAFRGSWFETLVIRAFQEREALARFDETVHEHDLQTFRDLDARLLLHNRARLAAEQWERLPRHEGGGQLATLRREFEKKSRHLPLRQLVARAGNAIKAIKPVFMMSPLSIATYLAPGSLGFDLVIFDEASQVKPVDAFGALLRARQAVVVGDSKQLPPTAFFDRLTNDEDVSDDEPGSGDLESILGLFVAQGARERLLNWHYRSRHESLIVVSNHEFYDDRLVVFPSPDAERGTAGLTLRHLPDAVYGRGKSRTNPGEADAVVEAVMAHAREQLARPETDRLTLGVASFSIPQMEAILDRLERRRREDPSCEPFFTPDSHEPFFVKNLENVQGDERDVILISIGYGRTAEGVVAMAFGPLNSEGGERRLNVLITRARVRCEVFTNLTASDIDLGRTQARGVRALKTFLAFAETGTLDGTVPSSAVASAPFEAFVRDTVTRSGWGVRSGVGRAPCAVDLGVFDSERPGRYRLGIDCNGPGTEGARSARDRDRLRLQVLEGLGWRLARAWSATWFRDRDGARARLLAAVEHSAASEPTPSPALTPSEPIVELAPKAGGDVAEATESPDPSASAAYRVATLDVKLGDRDLHELPVGRLAALVARVVQVEGPVHAEDVVRRVADAAGVKRLGSRIQASLDAAIERAAGTGQIERRGEFLWDPARPVATVRDRSGLAPAARRLELVAPEEIAEAVERTVADSYGMERAAIPLAVCRLLGFPRMTDDMSSCIDAIVAPMLEAGRLEAEGQHIVVPVARRQRA